MNRCVLCLQVVAVLVVAAWLGTTSPQELLPDTASAARFQVGIDQMSLSGGCLTEIPTPCPLWAAPNGVPVCYCTGPNDTTSCSSAEAEGEDEPGATLWRTESQSFDFYGFRGSYPIRTLCTTFYTCQPGCVANFDLGFENEYYTCNRDRVFEDREDSVRGDRTNYVWCDVIFNAQLSRESQQSSQLALVSGIGLELFPKE